MLLEILQNSDVGKAEASSAGERKRHARAMWGAG